MNSLSKIQALMIIFLLLVIAALMLEPLLLIPAAAAFLLQFPLARSQLKDDYPEDWSKYLLMFLVYEVVLVAVFYLTATTTISLTDFSAIYNIFILLIIVIMMTIVVRYMVVRNFTYGVVLFSAGDWVGVSLRSGLFSKVLEANYAVKNSLGLKVRKGDRVKVRVRRGLGRSVPEELTEVMD